jgi:hypothetical protein
MLTASSSKLESGADGVFQASFFHESTYIYKVRNRKTNFDLPGQICIPCCFSFSPSFPSLHRWYSSSSLLLSCSISHILLPALYHRITNVGLSRVVLFYNMQTVIPTFQRPHISRWERGLLCQAMCWHAHFVDGAVVCPTRTDPIRATAFCINTYWELTQHFTQQSVMTETKTLWTDGHQLNTVTADRSLCCPRECLMSIERNAIPLSAYDADDNDSKCKLVIACWKLGLVS